MNSNKFHKDRKMASYQQSKWDHSKYEESQKEEKNFEKAKQNKHKNNSSSYRKNDLNTLVSDKYQKVYTEKTADNKQESDDKWKHDKFNESQRDNNSFSRRNKGKKPDQVLYQNPKKINQQKIYEDKRNIISETIDEKEINIVDDKLSNVSTANSEKRNHYIEENHNNIKKIEFEFRILYDFKEFSIKIENLSNFDECLEENLENIGINDSYKKILLKIYFFNNIIEEIPKNSLLHSSFNDLFGTYLEQYETIKNERNSKEELSIKNIDTTLRDFE